MSPDDADALDRLDRDFALFQALHEIRRKAEQQEPLPLTILMKQSAIERNMKAGNLDSIPALRAEVARLQADNDRLLAEIKHLRERNDLDGLTSLKNAQAFEAILASEWNRHARTDASLALLFIDVDNFKAVNDTHDHLAGNVVLKAIADQLQRSVRRAGSVVARFGGDEFVALLPTSTLDDAVIVAELMRAGVEKMPITIGKVNIPVTISVGVAAAKATSHHDRARLLQEADQAILQAKKTKNTTIAYRDGAYLSVHVSQESTK